MAKTIEEINEKIKQGKAVIATAEEIIGIARDKGMSCAAREVDVVTTGTFGPMCSSGAYFNLGHAKPRIKLGGGKATLNDVQAYTGYAAADLLIGANALPDDDPRNRVRPGEFNYGGGHVIEELVAGRDVRLVASAYGTDCYPRKNLDTLININDLNEAVLFNPRNAYQNYNVAVNSSEKMLYTYMGILKPRFANANYCSAGQLSPLLNDPYLKTIGIGTRIFLGGGIGYVVWNGTQHNPEVTRSDNGVPKRGASTLAVIGDLKQMCPRWLRGVSMLGYGATLAVGIGVPIPILSDEILNYTLVSDSDILAPVVDYSSTFPQREPEVLAEVSYADLKSGSFKLNGKDVATASLSSYSRAAEIAVTLKEWLQQGKFLLTQPVKPLPSIGDSIVSKVLNERS
ncbi:MAG: homocysteine biosynthesis protein [Dehalococcoidia bacterium]|nr:homocysteine biosynthesis protein [Dehalococcoidia bacterium]